MWADNIVTNCTGLAYMLWTSYRKGTHKDVYVQLISWTSYSRNPVIYVRIFLTEAPFPCPQEPVTAPHSEPAESTLHSHT